MARYTWSMTSFFDIYSFELLPGGAIGITQKGVHMIPKDDAASPEDTATTVLIFEDEDKVQERVVKALQQVFFSHSKTGASISKANCEALFRALVRSQTGQSEEFRKLCLEHLDLDIAEKARAIIQTEFQAAVDMAVAKQIGALEKLAKQVRAVPKGPRR